MKPTFLVIGAAKCATTSLCQHLGSHPEAFICDPKEPFFFSHDRNYLGKGWPWYEALFARGRGKPAIGEGSVTYTQHVAFPEAAPRIAKHLPEARLIYITRHPLRQIESLWMMLRSFWRTHWKDGVRAHPDFNRAVREATPILLDTARYLKQIDLYRHHFPDDRILVVFFEDYCEDPDAVLTRCFDFLGIDPTVRIADAQRAVNVSAEHRRDRVLFKPVRLLPGAVALRFRLPERLRAALRPMLRRPVTERPQWAADCRRWVVGELAQESRTFLTRYGKPADFWNLVEPGSSPVPPGADVQ